MSVGQRAEVLEVSPTKLNEELGHKSNRSNQTKISLLGLGGLEGMDNLKAQSVCVVHEGGKMGLVSRVPKMGLEAEESNVWLEDINLLSGDVLGENAGIDLVDGGDGSSSVRSGEQRCVECSGLEEVIMKSKPATSKVKESKTKTTVYGRRNKKCKDGIKESYACEGVQLQRPRVRGTQLHLRHLHRSENN